MANDDEDLEELPEASAGGGHDLFDAQPSVGPAFDPSAFEEDAGPMLSDAAAERQMSRRTPIWAWLALIVLILVVVGGGFVYLRQSQGYTTRWDEYNAAQTNAEDVPAFLAQLRQILPDTQYEDVKIRILEKIAQYRDAESVAVVTTQVGSNLPTVRTAAARALAAIGSPAADSAKPELLRILPNTRREHRAAVVWALAVLGESAAADAIIEEFSSGRLQGQPGFDPAVISNVLGPQRLSSNALLNHEEVSVRTLTAAALAETASPDVIDPLSRMAEFELARRPPDEPDENVLRSIASGLGRAGDARAGQALFRILEAAPRQRAHVLDALRRTVGAPGIAALLPAAGNDMSIRRELVRMLANNHDPRAADALAGQLESEDEDIRQDAAFGLAELGDARAVPALIALAQGEDLTVGREALAKIQRLGVPDAADGLLVMLEDERFLGRRANLLRALGTTGATHVGPVIQRHLEGDDVGSAAAALADLNFEPAYAGLMRMMVRPRDVDFSTPTVSNEIAFTNRTAAVRAIGRYGRPDGAEALMTIIEDPEDDRRLRADAGFALGAIADDAILRTILEKLRTPGLDDVAKRYYVSALWQNPSASVATDLMGLVEDTTTEPDVRRAASLAVGYAASPELDARVATMLENEATRREAAFVIILGGTPAHAQGLVTVLGSDAELQQTLLFTLRDDESNAFNLLTQRAFESGEFWRRLAVAKILNEGEGDNRHGYVWNHLIERIRAGWDGHDGMTPRQIREALWNALRGDDAERRELVALVFATMDERGLLMSARDQGGPGSEEARAQLRRLNNPQPE